MESYHGTSSSSAVSIVSGTIDVTLGGGELGRGFYSGQHIHEAKAWAYHSSGHKTANVVKLTTSDSEIDKLDLLLLDSRTAVYRRHLIRTADATRTFIFRRDLVWAPIVGSDKISGDQYKWESATAENLLNDNTKTQREVV